MRALPLLVLAATCWFPARASAQIFVSVGGGSDPWLAGMPSGSTASCSPTGSPCDLATIHSPVEVIGLALAPGSAVQFSVGGMMALSFDQDPHPPDGTTIHTHLAGAENGISGLTAPAVSLIGVFLTDDVPNTLPAPPSDLDFTTPASRDFATLSPELRQPFFIGDGLDSSANPQSFIVPVGATRLFLGTMRDWGIMNNSGSYFVVPDEDADADGVTVANGDCNDMDATIFPGAPELCDGIDNDCDGVVPASESDGDLDGFSVCGGDCNDSDASVFPGNAELCDFLDNDCDGIVDEGLDQDGDGFTPCTGDCDDGDASVFPGSVEMCDGIDNDCDGVVDENCALPEGCNGDGGDQMGCTDCPCGNNAPPGTIGGCVNSANTSSRLIASGVPTATGMNAGAPLRFEATGVVQLNSCVLTSGNAAAPANMMNPCFGLNSGIQSVALDGLRCAVQGVLRHGVRASDVNGDVGVTNNGWGTTNGFFQYDAFLVGDTKFFQMIHRDNAALVCMTGQNTSQYIEVTFLP